MTMQTATEITFAGFENIAVVAKAAADAKEAERRAGPKPQIRREDVRRVYSGKQGCMCGCLGNYYCDKNASADVLGGSTVNAAQVTRILGVINAEAFDAKLNAIPSTSDEPIVILDIEETGRTLVLYLRPGADVSGFEVES
jgi:hypothetical protein